MTTKDDVLYIQAQLGRIAQRTGKMYFLHHINRTYGVEIIGTAGEWLCEGRPIKQLMSFLDGWIKCHLEMEKGVEKSEPKNAWIPVAESFPHDCMNVIVSTKIGVISTGNFYAGSWELEEGNFVDEVLAWQPLPQPYMKEGERNGHES